MISHHSPTRRPTHEERAFFETLVGLRAGYATGAAADARELISLRHAIAAANAAMHRGGLPSPVRRLGLQAN